jgi:6-phosphogluconate dehydrogenase
MDIGIIGLGRMGMGVSRRLLAGGHTVVAYNRSAEKSSALASEGAKAAATLQELVEALPKPRTVWLYLPAGETTTEHLQQLYGLLEPGDRILDGGNSRYSETLANAKAAAEHGLQLLDVGTSGGIRGETDGFCLMVGGDVQTFRSLEPLFKSVAAPEGFMLMGPVGSGHYVKMIHNAVEYGMMQAYAEGMDLLAAGPFGSELKLEEVATIWQRGSIVRSFLGELLEEALHEDATLAGDSPVVGDNGEGRWTVEEALANSVPVPVFAAAMFARYQTRNQSELAPKVLSALRRKFGGHTK